MLYKMFRNYKVLYIFMFSYLKRINVYIFVLKFLLSRLTQPVFIIKVNF